MPGAMDKPSKERLHLLVCGAEGEGRAALLDALVAGPTLGNERRDFTLLEADDLAQVSGDIVTGASRVDLALVLVDAQEGLPSESRSHATVAALLGVRQLVLVVGGMDRVDQQEARFDELLGDFRDLAAGLGVEQQVVGVPLAAGREAMPWYRGPSLPEALEAAEPAGDLPVAAEAPSEVTDQFMAHVIWFGERPMLPERAYVLKLGAQAVPSAITELKHKINVDNLDQLAAKTLERGEIGVCNIAVDQPITCGPYKESRALGGFLLVDRLSEEMLGVGMIDFGLRRATNLSWQDYDIGKRSRAAQKRQTPCVLWFTGLSGAGKSTIADLVDKKLHAMGQHCYVLDGDNVRHGLNKDLGFTDVDRVENIRRVAEVAKLFVDSGLIVLVSFISPFRSERQLAREMVEEGEFVEIFVDTPLAVCEERDPKGLYQKARSGQIANFTGIDSPYEPPEQAELSLDTVALSQEQAAEAVIDFMREKGLV